MALIQPFDLWNNFVAIFAGDMFIFIGIAFVLFIILAAKFRMNMWVFGTMMIMFGIFLAPWAQWLSIMLILAGGAVIVFNLMRLLNPK